MSDGCINILKTGWLQTKRRFGDCQLHVEWATPAKPDGNNLNWGNSGVFFMGKYELQIIESHDSKIYADGIAGAIYGQTPPLVNASRKPGQWQTFDAVFTAPRFDGEKLVTPAYLHRVLERRAGAGPHGLMGSTTATVAHVRLARDDRPDPAPAAQLGRAVPQYLDPAAKLDE